MISLKWIQQKESLLRCMAPGPGREALAQELADAKAQRAREEAELAQAVKAGFRHNQHPGTCAVTGETVNALQGFVRREKGRWVTYSWAAALAQAQATPQQ